MACCSICCCWRSSRAKEAEQLAEEPADGNNNNNEKRCAATIDVVVTEPSPRVTGGGEVKEDEQEQDEVDVLMVDATVEQDDCDTDAEASADCGEEDAEHSRYGSNKSATTAPHAEEDEEEEGEEAEPERPETELSNGVPLVQDPPPLSAFDQQMLDAHNAYRAHHQSPALVHSDVLARRAQEWAETLAKRNCMCHANQRYDGENLAMKFHSNRQNFPGTDFVNMWYYEGLNYRFPGTQPANQNTKNNRKFVTDHFTQVVWKNSKQVGFGRAVSKTGRVFVVARYKPSGNYTGWYNVNVLPPIDGKMCRRFQLE